MSTPLGSSLHLISHNSNYPSGTLRDPSGYCQLQDMSNNSTCVTHVDCRKLFSKKFSRDSNHTEATEPELVIPTETLANEIEQLVTQSTAETIENKTQ